MTAMEGMSMTEDYARKRARVAWEDVEAFVTSVRRAERGKEEEFRQWLKKVPAMVKTNGLAETMAFLYSKKGVQRKIYELIGRWVTKESVYASYFAPEVSGDQWLGGLLRLSSSVYRMVTVDVLAYVEWARRFAEGMLGVGTQEEESHDARG
ncbi:MAG: type III-B CRISPR module-associated protein Cmr5 [Brockia lithotrophica]|nr:type III-B CRISPR module-associated protein Cmr5 [Brockia lithotrophica]